MTKTLDFIRQPIQNELNEFNVLFAQSMKSDVALLDRVTKYIIKRKGKQIRPMFVFLCAKLCGKINKNTYVGASLVELLHTATLVHDDVVDDALERRGFFSINALWKNKIAVLVGDYLLSRGLNLAIENKGFKLLEIMNNSVNEMSEGELLQMEKARSLNITENIYFDIIKKKTATLIASACATGAASVNASEDLIKKMYNLGEHIGVAFQIKDDLFDFGEQEIGKPRGIDIKEKKMTLPLIYALNHCSKKERKHYIYLVKNENSNPKKVKEIIDFVKKSKGIDYTINKMIEYQKKALNILNSFENSSSKNSLIELLNYTINRSY